MGRVIINRFSAEQGEKIRLARLSVLRGGQPMSQLKLSNESGVHQTMLSALEYSHSATIPVALLYWFSQNGVNMNALLDPAIPPDDFKSIAQIGTEGYVPSKYQHMPDSCELCKEKEEKISVYKQVITTQEKLISQLESRLASQSKDATE